MFAFVLCVRSKSLSIQTKQPFPFIPDAAEVTGKLKPVSLISHFPVSIFNRRFKLRVTSKVFDFPTCRMRYHPMRQVTGGRTTVILFIYHHVLLDRIVSTS